MPATSRKINQPNARSKSRGGMPNVRYLSRALARRRAARLRSETLVFTGELAHMTRERAKEVAIKQGGRVSESVSRKTDFLVVGSGPGGTKTEKASKYGTTTLGEAKFLKLIK